MDEALTRTINNSFHNAFMALGECQIFSTYGKLQHEWAKEGLVTSTVQRVKDVHDAILEILRTARTEIEREYRLRELVSECAGSGHSAIVQELEHASGLPLMSLQGIC
jgi:hypothetical protein